MLSPSAARAQKEEHAAKFIQAYCTLEYIDFYGQQVRVTTQKMWTKSNGQPSYAFTLSNHSLVIINL